jgi:hypothetical protein
MRRLSVWLGAIFVGFLIYSYGEVSGADWRYFSENELGRYFYDSENVKHLPDHIISVWVKEISSPQSVTDAVNRFGKQYRHLSHMNILWEIDCTGGRSRVLEVLYYSKPESLISHTRSDADSRRAEWNSIIPDSMMEALSKAVCNPKVKEGAK